MEEYHTKRLMLRKATYEDRDFIFRLLNSPEWIKHIGDRNIRSLKDAEAYIRSALLDSYEKNDFGMYIMELKKKKEPIGLCGFLKRSELEHVDIGFALLSEYSRQGFTFEAAAKVIDESSYKTIYGITYEGNLPSRGILVKLAFRFERFFKFGNYEEDSMLYTLHRQSVRNL